MWHSEAIDVGKTSKIRACIYLMARPTSKTCRQFRDAFYNILVMKDSRSLLKGIAVEFKFEFKRVRMEHRIIFGCPFSLKVRYLFIFSFFIPQVC